MNDILLFMRKVIVMLLFLLAPAVQADEKPVPPIDRDTALAAIKKWRSFEGIWTGEIRYIHSPNQKWLEEVQPIRISFDGKTSKAYVCYDAQDWVELGTKYAVSQADELTVVIHAYRSGGVWTENHIIVLTRRSEKQADVYIQRVVNNWAGTPRPGEDLVYGDTRFGKVERK